MTTASAMDDNLIPGQNYTFVFSLGNIITRPSNSTLQSDLQANAPSFVNNNLIVTSPDTINPFSNIYYVQFTYNGDGSDVVSDVANEIVSAIKSGSNDDITLSNAYAENAQAIEAGNVVTDTIGVVTKTATDTLGKVTTQVGSSAQSLLTPVEIAIAIVVGLVVLLIFTSGKAGGVSASQSGVNIGGK